MTNFLSDLSTAIKGVHYPNETVTRLKDVASIFTAMAALGISYLSLKLSSQTVQSNRIALAEGIRPLLDLDFEMDARDISVRLTNKGLGIAIIRDVIVRRFVSGSNEVTEGHDPFRMFGFQPAFNWNRCKLFTRERTFFLPPKESFVLFHVAEDYLISQEGPFRG